MKRWRDLLRDRYFAVDARSLGFFRICFGLHLIANLYDRTKGVDALAFYTNEGVMPNHFALFAPMAERQWSLLYPFSTPGQAQVAFTLIGLVYAAYVVGWCTKLAQILVLVCLLSLTNRNLLLQNGGIVVTNVVAVWTMFLPLGARFSVDHLLKSLRERQEQTPEELNERTPMIRSDAKYARVAFLGIVLNFVCIYFFNYAHKTGLTWREGSAIHWVLWQNRIATMWAAMLRMHEPAWLSPLFTRATLIIEAVLPVLLLFPAAQKWTRRAAILAIWSLHCGISLMMTLGPFSYSMMSFSLLLIGSDDWNFIGRVFSWKGPRRVVSYDPANRLHHLAARVLARLDVRGRLEFKDSREAPAPSEAAPPALASAPVQRLEAAIKRIFGEILACVLLATVATEVAADNWIIAERYRVKHRPQLMRDIVDYLRLPQGWSMFSPEAPKEDGTIVVDAILSDGRHIDPRKQLPPDFDAAHHGPWFDDQQWCDFDLRMKFEGGRHFYGYFREYIAHLDQLDNWRQVATIKYFDVYWVNNSAPPPGSTEPYNIQKQLLFTGGVKP